MMSGDSGNFRDWPQLSLRDFSTSYRDYYFFENFNNPERGPRPVMPIANFMTHGIIYSTKKPFTEGHDLPEDWANHVMMHLGRGSLLKELYLSPKLFSEEEWEVLGRALGWAQANQKHLMNTVFIGGNVKFGQAYGYISWEGNKGILTLRNPDRMPREILVPFDQSVYFLGEGGNPYHARAIYPYLEDMPWDLESGEAFTIRIPGDRVLVYELSEGPPLTKDRKEPEKLPAFRSEINEGSYRIHLEVPDESFGRYDLLVQVNANAKPQLFVDGKMVDADRETRHTRWIMCSYDLRAFSGRNISIQGMVWGDSDSKLQPGDTLKLDVFLVADRWVGKDEKEGYDKKEGKEIKEGKEKKTLPKAISQDYRRLNQHVISDQIEIKGDD